MNTFYEHHKDSIRFQYACFDRILLNAAIPLLLEPTAAQGFFRGRNDATATKNEPDQFPLKYTDTRWSFTRSANGSRGHGAWADGAGRPKINQSRNYLTF